MGRIRKFVHGEQRINESKRIVLGGGFLPDGKEYDETNMDSNR